jgi:hypothetical protein
LTPGWSRTTWPPKRRGPRPGSARPEILDRQAGDVARKILDRRGAGALDVFLRLGVDREGNFEQGLLALGRGHDDRVHRLGLGGAGLRLRVKGDGGARQCGEGNPAQENPCSTGHVRQTRHFSLHRFGAGRVVETRRPSQDSANGTLPKIDRSVANVRQLNKGRSRVSS